MQSQSESLTSLVLLGGLGLVWGATFPVVRWGMGGGASPFALLLVDLGIAILVTAGVAAVTRSRRPSLQGLLVSMGAGALLIGGTNLTLFWGEQFATGGAAAIVYATGPLISTLAALVLGVRAGLSRGQSGALALGFLGVFVLAVTSSGTSVLTSPWAIVAFAIGAFSQGTGAVVVSRAKPEGEGRWGLSFQLLGAGIATGLIGPLLTPSLRFPVDLPVLGSVLFVALGTLTAGYLVYFELIRRAGPVRANLVTYVNPIVALALGALVFRESFQPFELVGLGVILLALVFLERTGGPKAEVRVLPPQRMTPPAMGPTDPARVATPDR